MGIQWTVEAGDNLWSIAENTLRETMQGAEPTVQEIAQHHQQIIANNLKKLKPDPDLIYRGLVLEIPGAGGAPPPTEAIGKGKNQKPPTDLEQERTPSPEAEGTYGRNNPSISPMGGSQGLTERERLLGIANQRASQGTGGNPVPMPIDRYSPQGMTERERLLGIANQRASTSPRPNTTFRPQGEVEQGRQQRVQRDQRGNYGRNNPSIAPRGMNSRGGVGESAYGPTARESNAAEARARVKAAADKNRAAANRNQP